MKTLAHALRGAVLREEGGCLLLLDAAAVLLSIIASHGGSELSQLYVCHW